MYHYTYTNELGRASVGSGPVLPEGAVAIDAAAFRAASAPGRPAPMSLAEYAAARRYAAETGGVEVGGVPFATDDRAKTLLLGARLAAQADPAFATTWYAADGSAHPLGAADVVAVSNAVLAHVSACFSTFGTVAAGIAAGAITTTAQVDAAFAALGA